MDNLFEDLSPSLDELALKNLDNLFNDKDFHLIYVDDDGSMSLVTPFSDESIRKEIKEYRCISHLWGTADKTKDYVWKDHGVDGVTWKVEVREEKRKRVMQIFRHHKGYFWMDVLCTNQDTDDKPLDVMGDIYRKCRECICLLDIICDVPGFDSEKELWIDVAEDVREYMETDRESLDSKYDNLREYDYDNSDISFGAKYREYLKSTRNAKWFQRVWTWQEAVLPPKLLFCSEKAGEYRYDPYSAELLRGLFQYRCLGKDMLRELCRDLYSDEIYSESDTDDTDDSKKLLEYSVVSDCVMHIKFFSMKHNNIWDNVRAMVVSTKECTNEEDFVYGVTGILDITVPKGLTLDKAVVELEKELQKYGIVGLEEFSRSDDPSDLRELYEDMFFVDGFRIFEEVDIVTLSKFSTNVDICGYEEYKISSKGNADKNGYVCYTCVYETGSWDVVLKTDSYNVGDILKATKIGRKDCTFRGYGPCEKSSGVAKIVDSVIEIAGIIRPTKADEYEE